MIIDGKYSFSCVHIYTIPYVAHLMLDETVSRFTLNKIFEEHMLQRVPDSPRIIGNC